MTLNPEMVMRARRDPGLRAVIARAALVTADGVGVVWAVRLAGQTIPERVTGIDLSEALLARAAALGYDAFLLGAADGVAEAAGARARGRFLVCVSRACGVAIPDRRATRRRRRASGRAGARLLLVAYGAPAQELWIARNLARCRASWRSAWVARSTCSPGERHARRAGCAPPG